MQKININFKNMYNLQLQIIGDVKVPQRGTTRSAGIDFFVPNDRGMITLFPNESINIASGVVCGIPQGFALIAMNKSGVALKKGLIVGACVIDEDYTGELHLHLINVTTKNVVIMPGEKLVQFLMVPVAYRNIEIVKKIKRDGKSERGDGGFGSTGTE